MQDKTEFLNIYKSLCNIDNKVLESNLRTTTDLFSKEQDSKVLELLQPNKLQSFIKPLSPLLLQYFEVQPIISDPETIAYDFFHSSYGKLLIAATKFGICYVSFMSDESISELQRHFPTTNLERTKTELQQTAIDFIEDQPLGTLRLHLKGTEFQLEVWKSLLKIPKRQLSTYKHLAIAIGKPKASIAIGAAVGKNPIALLIPCHRVIRSSGVWKGFRWGNKRKASLLIYELK